MMNGPRVPDFSDIIEIRNKHSNDPIIYSTLQIIETIHPYSSKKKTIKCLELDGEHVSKHKPYIIKYKCKICDNTVEVGICQYLRKIQKTEPSRCRYCVNLDPIKTAIHSDLLKNKPCTRYWKIEKPIKTILSIQEIKNISESEFYRELDSDEQLSYFTFHLTVEEFSRIKKHIISIYSGRLLIDNLEYFPIWKCSNQMKYTCMLYNSIEDKIEKPSQIQCKCEICDSLFNIKNLHSLKNKYKVLCQSCSLCRNTFKKRAMINNKDEKVIVQSQLEIKFVKWCQEKDILVRNGPKLNYVWNDTQHTYHVDFELPELKWLIEIKDMHIWHQQQITNGKWDAKEKVALEQVNNGTYSRFITLFPNNWMRILKIIQKRRYSLTLRENVRSID
jgi:hypothetical protein